jgi:hypothetical protein
MTKNRYNFYKSGLKFLATETVSIERLKDSPSSETDRDIVDSEAKMTSPIEMLIDLKERYRYGTTQSIQMAWIPLMDAEPLEKDIVIHSEVTYKVRKVQRWPRINPAFYELHLEEDN